MLTCRCKERIDQVKPLINHSQHPSISSASLQALCYTGGSDEYHLNDLRERLRIASPYPDNFRDTVQDWNSHESSSLS
ncbi:hypothetical protein ABFA07_005349 [Porites harrisoni]